MRKHLHLAIFAIARKLGVSIWYALRGFLPEILDSEAEMKRKFKKVAQELSNEYVKKGLRPNGRKSRKSIVFYSSSLTNHTSG